MSGALLARTCVCLCTGLTVARPVWGSRDLSFAERVAAERAISKVYYGHQSAATRPFDDAVSPEVLERSVRRTLGQSAALESFWNVPIRDDSLRTEMKRIARDTRFPERLREVYEALGHDAVMVEECLARRTLADRWARQLFARDPRIHGAARGDADTLRMRLIDGSLPLGADDPRRHVTEFTRTRSETDSGSRGDAAVEFLGERVSA
jgi:hypothetical protein